MWSLYKDNKPVQPLLYSNDKSQDAVIEEILEAFESYKVVFFKACVGSGKSVVALSVANKLGGGIVVTPTKILQEQYENDYFKNKYKILKDNKKWLKISVLKGRSNFNCLYEPQLKCNHKSLPCTRPVPKRKGKPVSRLEVAQECEFWSPTVPSSLEEMYSEELNCQFKSLNYKTTDNAFSILRKSKKVCPYYKQYQSYKSSDVVLMNSSIWMLETLALKRKPMKPVEIIDEGDAFLDGLSLKKSITRRMLEGIEEKLIIDKAVGKKELNSFSYVFSLFKEITRRTYEGDIGNNEKSFLKEFVSFLKGINDENSANYSDILHFLNSCYVSANEKQIEYFIPEPKIVVKKILELSSKKMLFMSATFQSEKILEDIFGFDNFCFIEGEPKFPGVVYPKQLGSEHRVTYKTWKYDEFKKSYWNTLIKAIKQSAKPCLIPVHAYKYLPDNIREKLRGNNTLRTKDGSVIFSTVMKRGVDLKDDMCRSIIMLKFPFPNTQEPILKAMRLKLGDEKFWGYYQDIAKREFIQTIGRGVRHKEDWICLYSPDKTVFGYLEKLWQGEINWNERKM